MVACQSSRFFSLLIIEWLCQAVVMICTKYNAVSLTFTHCCGVCREFAAAQRRVSAAGRQAAHSRVFRAEPEDGAGEYTAPTDPADGTEQSVGAAPRTNTGEWDDRTARGAEEGYNYDRAFRGAGEGYNYDRTARGAGEGYNYGRTCQHWNWRVGSNKGEPKELQDSGIQHW